MQKWFGNEGKYCVMFYLIVALVFVIGWFGGIGYYSLWTAIGLLIGSVVFLIFFSSYLMVNDYQKLQQMRREALQKKDQENEENSGNQTS